MFVATSNEMNLRFASNIVLVAGGTGVLGNPISLTFLSESAKVAVTYRRQEEFPDLDGAASANAKSLQGHDVDVMDEGAAEPLITDHGRLDALVDRVTGLSERPEVVGNGNRGF